MQFRLVITASRISCLYAIESVTILVPAFMIQSNTLRTASIVIGALTVGGISAILTSVLRSRRVSASAAHQDFDPGPEDAVAAVPKPAAENDGGKDTLSAVVFISDRGRRYHARGCRHLSGKASAVPIEDAWDRHYTPCAICNPLKSIPS